MSDVSSNASSAPDLVEDENEARQNAALGELGDLELEYDKAEVEICMRFPFPPPPHVVSIMKDIKLHM